MAENLVREKNMNTLKKILKREKCATVPRLSELTGISVVTVQSLMKALLGRGEALKDSVLQPQLGRPAIVYRFNEMARLALVICMHDVDGRNAVVFKVCNLYGECIERREKSYCEVKSDSFDPVIAEFLKQYPDIEVIGFGMPVVELEGRIVAGDCPGLRNINFAKDIQDRFARKVFVENDINVATAGFCGRNSIGDGISVVGLYMPEKRPPGAGLFHDGKIIKGISGFAGEVKYLPFGIDWDTFSHSKEDTEDWLVKAIKVFQCLLNPDMVVLYCEVPGVDIRERLISACKDEVEWLLMPDLITGVMLQEDMEAGMVSLALTMIS